MSNELHVKGTTLEVDVAGGTTYVPLGRLKELTPPPKKRGAAETTNMSSADDYREFIPGWKEGGEPEFTLYFYDTDFATLDSLFESGATARWRMAPPVRSGQTVPPRFVALAWIMELSPPQKSVDGDNVWETNVKLKITGKPTFSAGS
jgi:hypothetical protein